MCRAKTRTSPFLVTRSVLTAALVLFPPPPGLALQTQGRPDPGPENGGLGSSTRDFPTLFSSEEPLEIALEADFRALKGDRGQESEERPATVTVIGSEGRDVEVPIKVRTRGRFRLQGEICPDPPLRLNFPNPTPYGTLFDGQDKLKLVTHCRDTDAFEQNILEEYLAYRIYNQLTEKSLRVQLVEVTYRDTSGDSDPVVRLGFLIEDEEAMASRLGGRMVEVPGIYPNQFEMGQISLLYLFYFMIGNVDWGTAAGHNVKILEIGDERFPVPYDFDFSGLVDAPYAKPSELTQSLHESVRERLYRGVCMPGVDYHGSFERFNRIRESVLALAQRQHGLSGANRDSAVAYLGDFYRIINDPTQADLQVIKACRPWL